MYQGNIYVVLNEYEMSNEEQALRETHTEEERTLARNPNDTILPDELNDETAQRWCL